jgi:ribonuclease HI
MSSVHPTHKTQISMGSSLYDEKCTLCGTTDGLHSWGKLAEPCPEALRITAYTDGACKGNPGPGGWGFVMTRGRLVAEGSGGAADTTNNRMELMGAIMALRYLSRPSPITIITDSAYVKNGITSWIKGWKANGWKTSRKEPVKNADLWQQLDALCVEHQVTWQWVKGHSGDSNNDKADELANLGVGIGENQLLPVYRVYTRD